MGLLVIGESTRDRAPLYFTNTHGRERWSEKTSDQIVSQNLCSELIQFCASEGYRRGWNDARLGVYKHECPFHPDFLEGRPYSVWIFAYFDGSLDQIIGEPISDAGYDDAWP